MFCAIASPAQRYISLALKTGDLKVKDHWNTIDFYTKCEKFTNTHIDTIIPNTSELDKWADDLFIGDIDGLAWVSNLENLRKLEHDSLRNS